MISAAPLLDHLRQRLPAYLLPSAIVVLPRLPEHANTLKPRLEIRFPRAFARVFARLQVAIKEAFKIGEVDAMIIEIAAGASPLFQATAMASISTPAPPTRPAA